MRPIEVTGSAQALRLRDDPAMAPFVIGSTTCRIAGGDYEGRECDIEVSWDYKCAMPSRQSDELAIS